MRLNPGNTGGQGDDNALVLQRATVFYTILCWNGLLFVVNG